MKTEKLFRETAFGGYKREDVLEYLKQSDQDHRTVENELRAQLTEAVTKATEYEKRNSDLSSELEKNARTVAKAVEQEERLAQLEQELQELKEHCETLEKSVSQSEKAFTCEKLNGSICPAVTERAEQIIADAEEQAKDKIRSSEEQATGIITNARMEAQAMITEAEGNSDIIARLISDQAHEIIEMTTNEARGILDTAKQKGNGILSASAQSIGKIKGNLSSMQLVVRNIEGELKAAKDSITESFPKKED